MKRNLQKKTPFCLILPSFYCHTISEKQANTLCKNEVMFTKKGPFQVLVFENSSCTFLTNALSDQMISNDIWHTKTGFMSTIQKRGQAKCHETCGRPVYDKIYVSLWQCCTAQCAIPIIEKCGGDSLDLSNYKIISPNCKCICIVKTVQ